MPVGIMDLVEDLRQRDRLGADIARRDTLRLGRFEDRLGDPGVFGGGFGGVGFFGRDPQADLGEIRRDLNTGGADDGDVRTIVDCGAVVIGRLGLHGRAGEKEG